MPWEKVAQLGWSKLREIAPVLTLGNVDHWVALAKKQNHVQLVESVKAAQGKKGTPDQVSTVSFYPDVDQRAKISAAINKAKVDANTGSSSVALEYICLDFLGGQTLAQRLKSADPATVGTAIKQAFGENKDALAAIMGAIGIEKALNAVSDAAPTLNITVEVIDPDEEGQSA